VKGDGILVLAKEATGEFDLSGDFTADQAAIGHDARLAQHRVTFPHTGPREALLRRVSPAWLAKR
jgi:hypothetical protein